MRISMVAALALGACGQGTDAAQPVQSEAPQVRIEAAKPRAIDPEEFLSKAVTEGLTEDGADRTFVGEFIAGKGDLFVPKCRICYAVRKGFDQYAKGAPAEGKGIPKDISDELKHGARLARLNALERLVDRYVARHYDRLKVTAEERIPLQASLEEWKKEGMKMKEWGAPKFGDFCPSCNGAAKAR